MSPPADAPGWTGTRYAAAGSHGTAVVSDDGEHWNLRFVGSRELDLVPAAGFGTHVVAVGSHHQLPTGVGGTG